MPLYEQYADTMHDVLPQPSREAIRRAMANIWPGITISIVDQTLLWIRKNPDLAGFNVGYAKRGMPGFEEGDRYFAINKDDPSFRFTSEHRDHFDAGLNSAIQALGTTVRITDGILEAGEVHESLQMHRDAIADLREDIAACFRTARRLQRDIKKKQNL